jgi:large subunit ribosomal protein L2
MKLKLRYGFHFCYGRDNTGQIASFHRGGGHKRLYRVIDFTRSFYYVWGKVIKIIKDPQRSASLFVIAYTNKVISYQLAIDKIKVGEYIRSYNLGELDFLKKIGTSGFLTNFSLGVNICNLEYLPYTKGKIARSAGVHAKLLKKYEKEALVKLPSGEYRLFSLLCKATIGQISNKEHKEIIIGKAGISRRRGIRPHVRGIAMNPVDHPHGGRTNGGKIPVTPWGKLAKGVKTSKSRKLKKNILNKSL